MSRRAFVAAAVVTALMALAAPAKACSCALGDPRDALARSDGAFVGTLLSRRPAVDSGGEPDLQTDVLTFQVDEDVKGEYPDTFDVYSASSGAAWARTACSGSGRYAWTPAATPRPSSGAPTGPVSRSSSPSAPAAGAVPGGSCASRSRE